VDTNVSNLTYCEVGAQLIETGLVSSKAVLDTRELAKFPETATDTLSLLLYVPKSLLNIK
jgi:hypothetical protein